MDYCNALYVGLSLDTFEAITGTEWGSQAANGPNLLFHNNTNFKTAALIANKVSGPH